MKTLSMLGHNVTLLTYPEGTDIQGFRIIRVPLIPFFKNIPIGPSIHKILYDFLLLIEGLSIIRKKRFDVIHSHEIDGAIVGAILKKVCNRAIGYKPMLYYDMHSLLSEQMRNKNYKINFLLDNILNYIEFFAYRNSDRLLMISPSFVNRLMEFNQNEKALFLPDIPALKEELVDPETYEYLKNKIKHKIVFLYMGNIENYQGVYLLLEAFKIVERSGYDTGLVIVGGTKEEIKNLEKAVNKYGLARVYLFSQQPLEKMPAFLKLSDIAVSPRLRGTNIPYKIYPYMRMGKPIIATDIPAHNLILENNKNALLCELDPVNMGNKMLLLLQDDSIRKSIGNGARDLFEKNFSSEIYRDKLENLYR
ncbi:MAG: glycosyltransferase family 4 protein [Candidatus Methanoperedens sp.]|nr:glycosyltransferase family 4 protein [Candidatus Methanoperedens sp.]